VHNGDAWLIVSTTPPAVMVPVRAVPALAATVNAILALPEPDDDESDSQLALLFAVHEHPPSAEIAMVPAPPAAAKPLGLALAVRSHGEPSCRTRARLPLTLIELSRALPGFAAAWN
jgi:hypothetical protein